MKYGVMSMNIKDGTQGWCLKNGESMSFDFCYEAAHCAAIFSNVTNNPGIRYQAMALPEMPAGDSKEE